MTQCPDISELQHYSLFQLYVGLQGVRDDALKVAHYHLWPRLVEVLVQVLILCPKSYFY